MLGISVLGCGRIDKMHAASVASLPDYRLSACMTRSKQRYMKPHNISMHLGAKRRRGQSGDFGRTGHGFPALGYMPPQNAQSKTARSAFWMPSGYHGNVDPPFVANSPRFNAPRLSVPMRLSAPQHAKLQLCKIPKNDTNLLFRTRFKALPDLHKGLDDRNF